MTQETKNLAADLWALADLLRGDFKQSQYGRVILPFALLRRLECVLETSKSALLYVVRPQFFVPLITLLRNAALNAMKYKSELALVRSQNVD
jgi:type I restriction-modification system DNA methylase subunit